MEAQKQGLQVVRLAEIDGSQPSRVQEAGGHRSADPDFRTVAWVNGTAKLRAMNSSQGHLCLVSTSGIIFSRREVSTSAQLEG